MWTIATCGCGLAQQCVRGLYCGYHGAGGGICNGGRIVGVLCLGAAVALQRLRLGEHSLTSKTHFCCCYTSINYCSGGQKT